MYILECIAHMYNFLHASPLNILVNVYAQIITCLNILLIHIILQPIITRVVMC